MQKVITGDIPSFIGGRLVEPGTVIEIDEDEAGNQVAIAAPSTPVGNMNLDELEAYVRSQRKKVSDSVNLADPAKGENVGAVSVPIADITPRSASSTLPQGVPSGAVEVNGQFYAPAAAGSPAGREVFTAPHVEAPDLNEEPAVLDARQQVAGDGLTKAEIVQALKDRGDKVDTTKTKAELQDQLSAPPKA